MDHQKKNSSPAAQGFHTEVTNTGEQTISSDLENGSPDETMSSRASGLPYVYDQN